MAVDCVLLEFGGIGLEALVVFCFLFFFFNPLVSTNLGVLTGTLVFLILVQIDYLRDIQNNKK